MKAMSRTRELAVALSALALGRGRLWWQRRLTEADDDGRLAVATTVAPITSIVSNIGGDRVRITGIVPEGTNSHTFEPEPSVAELLSSVDVVYLNGLVLEEPTKELAEENLADGAEVIELGSECIEEPEYAYDFSFPESGGKPNPHLWTNPRHALCYAEVARDDLSARDPDNADYYAEQLRRRSRRWWTSSTSRCASRSRRSRSASS